MKRYMYIYILAISLLFSTVCHAVYDDGAREIEVKGRKIWEDLDNKYNTRPDSIEVTRKITTRVPDRVDYDLIESKIVTAADNWEYDFGVFKNFVLNIYYVTETSMQHWTNDISQQPQNVGWDNIVFEPYLYYSLYNDGVNRWEYDKFDIVNILMYNTKDVVIKKVDEKGNPIPNTKFDIYAVCNIYSYWYYTRPHSGELFNQYCFGENYINLTVPSILQKGGYFFTNFYTSNPFPSKAERYDGSSSYIYVYTPLLKFTDGTTLLDFINQYNRLPIDEYTLADIDYKNTDWYAIDFNKAFDNGDFLSAYNYQFEVAIASGNVYAVATDALAMSLYTDDLDNFDEEIFHNYRSYYEYDENTIEIAKKYMKLAHLGKVELSGTSIPGPNIATLKYKVGEYITDGNGEIKLNDVVFMNQDFSNKTIHYNSIEIKETETADDKYILDDTTYTLNLENDNTITVVNKERITHGWLKIKKITYDYMYKFLFSTQ